ncbi:MAG: type IX secretion system sortase PorU [Prevotellaceae bacterium]|nr:type IX secretion system sortase PorU [Prevotellaceae bacterium]
MSILLVFCAGNAQDKIAKPRAGEALTSALSSGRWVKLRVKQTGVYCLTAAMLRTWGFPNASAVSVWGNGCSELPRRNSESHPDDLLQMPAKASNGNVFFYAEAKNTWRYNAQKKFFEHAQNEYTSGSYVYITDGKPTKDIPVAAQAANATNVTETYDYRDYRERIDTNLLRSGRRFFDEVYDQYPQHNISYSVPGLDMNNPLMKLQVCAAARNTTGSSYTVQVNGEGSYTLPIRPVTVGVDAMCADTALFENIVLDRENITLRVTFNKPDNSPSTWGLWDFSTINARAKLELKSAQLLFRDAQTMGAGKVTRFSVATTQRNVRVWDVSKLHDVQEVGDIAASGNINFVLETEQLRELVAFTESMAMQPEFVGELPNQNLHGAPAAELIIVTHPDFADAAKRLAKFHEQHDKMSVLVATSDEVYNEFSSGMHDASAIRNFVRMFYRRNPLAAPKYLLLLGDGSYVNYESRKGAGLLPTYESDNSLVSERSFVSDDFFVLLDDDEYLGDNGMSSTIAANKAQLDMAVGRLPASTLSEANAMVSKVEQYSANLSGDWMSKCIIIADDKDNNDHMRQAEAISCYIMDSAPSYYVNRIYLDAYVQLALAQGKRYPDATSAIASAIGNGAMLVNYTGHANDQWLSHEQVVTMDDIRRWNNRGRYPMFVTATCEFSRYDDFNARSAGEAMLAQPNGGAIAMLSTTRLVYSSSNAVLNQKFIEYFFTTDGNGKHLRIGDMVRHTKNSASTGVNQLNFTLLGDPAMMLNFATLEVNTTRINSTALATPDTLKALAHASISGMVRGATAGVDTIFVSVFDKEQTKLTLGNSGETPFAYRSQTNLLYRGKAVVRNGEFTARFVVPQDIIPSIGQGKITYVGKYGEQLAAGSSRVPVGGASSNAIADTTPPSVRMYMNNEQWVPGGITNETPTLIAHLADSSGINTVGNGAGRDITLSLLQNNKSYNLNNYYAANADSYTSGRVEFPIPPLEKGPYTATLKVWDVANNAAEQSVDFRVADEEKFTLSHVLNYPNPFTQRTAFFFEHNRPYTEMEAMVQIFTISGKLIKTLRQRVEPSNNALRSAPIEWDGCDDFGARIGRGTYIYKVKVRCQNGEHAEKVEKLVVLH